MDADALRDRIRLLQEEAVSIMAVEADLERRRAQTRRGTQEYAAIQEQLLQSGQSLSAVVAAIGDAHAQWRRLLEQKGLLRE